MGRVYLARDSRLEPPGRPRSPLARADEQPPGHRPVPPRGQGRRPAPAREPRADLRRGGGAAASSTSSWSTSRARTSASCSPTTGPIPPADRRPVARQVALGLEHAHEKGLIHRDVNPMNILITRDGTAKLTDLGLAIDLADHDDIVTRDGATVGTFDYISPRAGPALALGRHPRADIYSLGCTLFHMIAGRVPFPTPSLPEKLYAHQLHEPEPLSGRGAGRAPGVRCGHRQDDEQEGRGPLPDGAGRGQALEPWSRGPPRCRRSCRLAGRAAGPAAARRPRRQRDRPGRLAGRVGPGAGLNASRTDAAAMSSGPRRGDAPRPPRARRRDRARPGRPPAASSCDRLRPQADPGRLPLRRPPQTARAPAAEPRQPPGTNTSRATRGRSGPRPGPGSP